MATDNDSHKVATHVGRREQLGIGLIFALAALIIAPTFWRGLPCGHDTLTHFYRVVQLALNVQEEAPFTQWGQHFMRGYGYTIYPFYAPLTYWLTTVFHFLGFDFSPALRLVTWLALFLAGWGGYNLGRRYFNPAGAFVTGLAYLFAPYLLYNATQRGAIPELLGLALLPWAMTAADIAVMRRTPRSLVTAVFAFALVVLSHNVVPTFGFIFLLGLAFSRSRELKPGAIWQAVWPALTVMGLSLLMTSFFWLPAYVELDFTQIRRQDSPFADWPRFEQHFLNGDELVGFPEEPADPALTNPPLSLKIGLGPALMAAVGVVLSLVLPLYRRPWLWLWAFITFTCLFLVTSLSWPLWATMPLPEFVQLPTRFLGPASLGSAVLAGIVADWLGRRLAGFVWPQDAGLTAITLAATYGLATLMATISGWPWLFPTICAAPVQPTAATVAQATQWDESGHVIRWGGASLGETLPRWVDVLPDADVFIPAYETGDPANRLLLPETAVLLDWSTHAKGDGYVLQLAEPVLLTYRAFYVPYWRAEINGQPAPLQPKAGDGLIQVEAPAGEVALSFTFDPTPLRVVTLIVSGLCAIALLWWRRQPQQAPFRRAPPSRRQSMLFGGVAAVLWLVFAYVNLTDNAIRADRLVDGKLQGIAHPAHISFDGEFTYLGYEGQERVPADQSFRITQYWRAENEIGVPYRFRLRIADDAGRVWQQPIGRPPSYASLPGKPGWQTKGYARDAYEFNLLPGTPPGVYWLEASAFRSDTDLSLISQGTATAVNPAWARVGQLEVTPGEWDLTAENAQVGIFAPTSISAVPSLTLLGWTVPDVVWQPGQLAGLHLLWQGDQASLGQQVAAELWLQDEAGRWAAQTTVTVGSSVYPMAAAADTAVVRNQVRWRLPPALETGVYTIWLSVEEQSIRLGEWQVEAPPRTFTPPEVDTTSNFAVSWGRLVGYSGAETAVVPGSPVELELVWQATAETPTSYRVFVHLLAEDGRLITQSDAVPDRWTRPTTGWIAGEYIRDRHTLVLPVDVAPGTYKLVVGLYETATGSRLGESQIGRVTVVGKP